MRTATLMVTGLAALGAGIAGGLATHPVAKIPAELDWRQRYHATPPAAPAPVMDEASYSGSWPYGLPPVALARLYPRPLPAVDLDTPAPALERPLPQDPWRPDLRRDRDAQFADNDARRAEDQDAAGRAAVQAALTQTDDMGPGPGYDQDSDVDRDPYEVDPGHGPASY